MGNRSSSSASSSKNDDTPPSQSLSSTTPSDTNINNDPVIIVSDNKNNNSNNNTAITKQTVEDIVLNRFTTILQNQLLVFNEKIVSIVNNDSNTTAPTTTTTKTTTTKIPFEAGEYNLLYHTLTDGVWKSLAVGIVSLITLRTTRSIVFNRKLASATTTNPTKRSPSRLSYVFGWLLDSLVSCSVTTGVSLCYFMNIDTIGASLSKVPLVEGKSIIANTFCPIMNQEYTKLQKQSTSNTIRLEYNDENQLILQDSTNNADDDKSKAGSRLFGAWNSKPVPSVSDNNTTPNPTGVMLQEIIKNPQSQSLQSIFEFCTNCQKRYAYYEEYQRQSNDDPNTNNENDDDSITIPPPGVPPDYPIS